MLAAVFQGKHQIAVEDIPVRQPEPDEIVIKVAACGVCGTDLHIYHGDKGAAECPPGTVLGHEFSGTSPRSAVPSPALQSVTGQCRSHDYCGACYYCRNGQAISAST